MTIQSKRNGKIELLRFIFCAIIVLYHINTRLYGGKLVVFGNFNFFHLGFVGVEFFFLLSGFLLAKVALKNDEREKSLGSETVSFMKRKILPLVVPHTICFFLCFATYCILSDVRLPALFSTFVRSLPNLFFLQKMGISYISINFPEWYISRMLFSVLIVFPLCRKFKKTYTNIVAPVIGILLIGYIVHKYGTLSNVKVFDFLVYKCQLRAFAEINLGVAAYSISEKLRKMDFSRFERIVITLIEAACFLYAIYFTLGFEDAKYSVYALGALFVAIPITFSDVSFGNRLFNNRISYFLGKLSLPMYLVQLFAKDLVTIVYPDIAQNKPAAIISVFSLTLILGVALLLISKPLEKKLTERIERMNGNN